MPGMRKTLLFIIAVLLSLAATAVGLDTPIPATHGASGIDRVAAVPVVSEDLVLFNRRMFSFRTPLSGVSA